MRPNQTKNKKREFKKPVDVFKKCPVCGAGLLKFYPDVFCEKCDWDSLQAYVDTGAMEDQAVAWSEHFGDYARAVQRLNMKENNSRRHKSETIQPKETRPIYEEELAVEQPSNF